MTINSKIVVTGMGIMSPFNEHDMRKGNDSQWNHFDFNSLHRNTNDINITKRQLKKIDKFTVLALTCIKKAFDESKSKCAPDEAGLLIGNVFGGWDYVESQLNGLYQGNFDSINPYVATAWFPAAPQGEASILYQFGGYSKTFSADTLSAAFAIEHGIDLIRTKKLKMACCGGVEAPVNAIISNASCFHSKKKPYSMTDTSAFFCLEENQLVQESGREHHFSIDLIKFGRSMRCINYDIKHLNASFSTLVCSDESLTKIVLTLFPKINVISTEMKVGQTFSTAFAFDLYFGYISSHKINEQILIIRKCESEQYVICLITISNK